MSLNNVEVYSYLTQFSICLSQLFITAYHPQPTERPSISGKPSSIPSESPSVSAKPSGQPTENPSVSDWPTTQPSGQPSLQPSEQPSITSMPSSQPSTQPSSQVCIHIHISEYQGCDIHLTHFFNIQKHNFSSLFNRSHRRIPQYHLPLAQSQALSHPLVRHLSHQPPLQRILVYLVNHQACLQFSRVNQLCQVSLEYQALRLVISYSFQRIPRL